MKASDATSNDQNCEKRQAHGATFAKVLDGRKQPICGLWIRGTRYYARLNVENPLTGIKKNQRVLFGHEGRLTASGSNDSAGDGRIKAISDATVRQHVANNGTNPEI